MTSYEKRLDAVRTLGARLPGYPVRNSANLGLWTGIFMQTKWQKDSGRSELPIWHLVNESLTILPFQLLSGDADEGEKTALSPTHTAWLNYFSVCRDAQKLFDSKNPLRWIHGYHLVHTRVRTAMWHAHTEAIRHALRIHRNAFNFSSIPKKELVFWFNWIRIVLASENIAPPTHKLMLGPLLSACMPTQSPLGSTTCDLKKEPTLRQLFISRMTYDERSLDAFIASIENGGEIVF